MECLRDYAQRIRTTPNVTVSKTRCICTEKNLTEARTRHNDQLVKVAGIRKYGQGTPGRGMGILLRPSSKARVIRKHIKEGINAVWLRLTNNVDIITMHMRPNVNLEEAEKFLNVVHRKSRYPLVLAGDLNCRPTDWCAPTNRNGRSMQAWAAKHHIKIAVPLTPHFEQATEAAQ